MRGLVVGLGSIGRRHARNWAALGLGPLAVCRQARMPQPEPLGVAAREFFDLDEALNAQPEVVLVTNPTRLHLEVACRAVRAGAHVLIEKPLADSLEGVAELLDLATRERRQLMVGYNLRFHPGLLRLRELVHQQAIGRVVSVRAEVGEYLPDWHPWEDYRQAYSGRRELGGGAILTFSHELDAVCWLLGAPTRVMALAAHASSLEIDTEDVAEIVVQFTSGALANIHVDYVRREPRRCIEVIGEEGVLRWEYEANRLLRYVPAVRQWRAELGDADWTRNDMYEAELRHFAACARGEVERPLIDGRQGAAVLAIALASLRSSETGQAIDLQAEGEPVTTWLRSLGSF
jgi:predicted dehydrogenase